MIKKSLTVVLVLGLFHFANARTVTCDSSAYKGKINFDDSDLKKLIHKVSVNLPLFESQDQGTERWKETYKVLMVTAVDTLIEIQVSLDASGYNASYQGADSLTADDYGSGTGSSVSLGGKHDYWEGYKNMNITVMSNGGTTHLKGISKKLKCVVNN